MPKIMLVEDDKSLREIYSIRLVAEGYEVISAGDGEEALALAVQQKPDLIVSDVMMPKISGFDMLDILRSTPETKDIKVIMMTALSSEEQRQRGESLGANKYLVKSQVGIEDVINAVNEVLGDKGSNSGTASTASSASADAMLGQRTESTPPSASPASLNPSVESVPVPNPAAQPAPAPQPTQQAQPVAQSAQPTMGAQPQQSTAQQMEAILNENAGAPNVNWPGTPAQ